VRDDTSNPRPTSSAASFVDDAVEVGVVAAAFHSSVANKDVYRKDIKHLCDLYQRDVSPIGEVPFMSEGFPPEATWIEDGSSKRLAITTYMPGWLGVWGNKYLLDSWVEPQMQPLAIEKQMAKFGRIDTVDKDELREIH
jgi:hypothetical protein